MGAVGATIITATPRNESVLTIWRILEASHILGGLHPVVALVCIQIWVGTDVLAGQR